MNNKGFVLMETLVMSAVIIVLLAVCYYPFASIVNNNKTYQAYDNVEDIYKLNNVRLFIYKYIGVNNIIEGKVGDGSINTDSIISIKNVDIKNDVDNIIKTKFTNLLEAEEIENLYLVEYNLSDTDFEGKQFSYDMQSYFSYINNSNAKDLSGGELSNTYRLVAKFQKDGEEATYANIKIWKDGE